MVLQVCENQHGTIGAIIRDDYWCLRWREMTKLIFQKSSFHVNNFSYYGSISNPPCFCKLMEKLVVGKYRQYFVPLTQKNRTLSLVWTQLSLIFCQNCLCSLISLRYHWWNWDSCHTLPSSFLHDERTWKNGDGFFCTRSLIDFYLFFVTFLIHHSFEDIKDIMATLAQYGNHHILFTGLLFKNDSIAILMWKEALWNTY